MCRCYSIAAEHRKDKTFSLLEVILCLVIALVSHVGPRSCLCTAHYHISGDMQAEVKVKVAFCIYPEELNSCIRGITTVRNGCRTLFSDKKGSCRVVISSSPLSQIPQVIAWALTDKGGGRGSVMLTKVPSPFPASRLISSPSPSPRYLANGRYADGTFITNTYVDITAALTLKASYRTFNEVREFFSSFFRRGNGSCAEIILWCHVSSPS